MALVALAACATAGASAPARPDAHDRALVAALDARIGVFRDIAASTFGTSLTRAFRACRPLEQHLLKSKHTFGAAFSGLLTSALVLSVPLTTELADRHRGELVALQTALEGMRPDAALFERWRTTEVAAIALILDFGNGGQPVDACNAATYLEGLSSAPSSAQPATLARFTRAVGITLGQYETLAAKLFSSDDPAEALSSLEPGVKAFFLAAGLSAADAAVMSASE